MEVRRERPRVWLWMTCIILIVGVVGTTAWSKYTNQRDGGGKAVIASLVNHTEFTIDTTTLPSKPGQTTTVKFKVTNFEGSRICETMLHYTLLPETAGNLPLTFTLSRDESAGAANGNWIPAGSVAGNTASTEGTFEAGQAETHRYTLTIAWPVEASDGDAIYADEVDYVRLKIHASQVSPKA